MHLLSAWMPILLAAHCQSADASPTLELPPSSAVAISPRRVGVLSVAAGSALPPTWAAGAGAVGGVGGTSGISLP